VKLTDISPYDGRPEPIYHRYLEYLGPNAENVSGQSDKFWEVAVLRCGDGKFEVVRRWGKYGAKGRIKPEVRRGKSSAISYARRMKNEKRDKGYTREIDVITRMGSLLDDEEDAA